MASSGIGDLLKYGLLAGGAYLAWKAYSGGTVAATAPSTTPTSTGTSTAPTYAYVPPTVTQALAAAAVGNAYFVNGQMNADQWSYLWTNSLNKPALDPTLFSNLFFPGGRPSNPANNPMMTADTFVQALATKGISGPPGSARVPVPFLLIRGRGYAYSPFWRQVG